MPAGSTQDVVRAVLIDSHDIFLRGASLALQEQPGIEVVAECGDFSTGVQTVADLRPEVVVVGLRPHEHLLLQRLGHLRAHSSATRVVVMSRRDEDHAVALRQGAHAVLGKDAGSTELASTIAAAASDTWAPPRSGDPAALEAAAASLARSAALATLTRQERRILGLIGQGMTNREIAENLFLAEKTVRNHVTRLLAKLGVSRRTQAALIAVRLGPGGERESAVG